MMKNILSLALLAGLFMTSPTQAQSAKEILYVGTYSTRGSEGLYVFEFDRANGVLRPVQSVANAKSPTFLEIHPNGRFLYAANEGDSQGENKSGSVSAYAIDPQSGKLTFLNQQLSGGNGPCHVSIDKTGKLAFISNYGGGSVSVLPIQENGTLGAATDHHQHTGSGVNKERQEKAHIHSAILSPDDRFLYVSDLGTDKVYIYEIDPAGKKIKPARTPYVSVKPGSGPRHFIFHPNGRYAYLAEEMASTVAVFSFDAKTGALKLIEDNVKSLPDDYTGTDNTSADIHTDPTGKFLYLSNRGHNSLAIYAIGDDGKLTLTGRQETLGQTPRNFMVDDRGAYVLAANQGTDNLIVFKRDPNSGKLTPVGNPVHVPAPVCLKMLSLK